MFKQATDKTFNLLASGYAYPRDIITNFAKADDEAIRAMFWNLFDGYQNLAVRWMLFKRLQKKCGRSMTMVPGETIIRTRMPSVLISGCVIRISIISTSVSCSVRQRKSCHLITCQRKMYSWRLWSAVSRFHSLTSRQRQ